MKKYKVTFREWMYRENEIFIEANSKKEAIDLAHDEMLCPKLYENRGADWYASEFRELKPKVRINRN